MLNGELCSCFLPQRYAINCVSLTNSRAEHSLRTGAARKLDQGLFDYVGFFFPALGDVPSRCAVPSLRIVESEGIGGLQSWDIATEGWGIGLSCCHASIIILTAISYPCLYCCSHQDQSWLFITPISAPLCSHFGFRREPSSSS